jgi:hypothetical protein
MKYAVKTVSGAMIYILCFMKSGSRIQKLLGRNVQANRQAENRRTESMEIVLAYSHFLIEERRLIKQ